MITRRAFASMVGGVAAWPLPARAHEGERMRRISLLLPATANDPEFQARVAAFLQELQKLGLDSRPQRADRHPMGYSKHRGHSQTCGRTGGARAGRHRCPWRVDRGAIAAGDPNRVDRVSGRRRSGLRRLCRQSGAAGGQHHRLHDHRIQHERKMAGASQGDHAEHDAGGGRSGSNPRRRNQPAGGRSSHGAVA